jgi:uncharacterized coiled-coil protein SlyX
MGFLALLLVPLTAQASREIFVEVELSCGPTSDKKQPGYTDRLYGAISGPSIALTRSLRLGESFSSMYGYVLNDKLIIKGEGRIANSNDTWKLYFFKYAEGTIKNILKGGVEGKNGSRKCKLTYIQDVPNETAFRGQKLVIENAQLRKQVKELEGQVSSQADTSENLVQMATVIDSLKDQLSNKDNRLAELNGQVASLEEKMASNATKNQQTINGLEAEITEKNNNIQSLTTAIQTLQNTPAKAENCPEVEVSAAANDDNNPIVKYLEVKMRN